jgi:hypothetical protein
MHALAALLLFCHLANLLSRLANLPVLYLVLLAQQGQALTRQQLLRVSPVKVKRLIKRWRLYSS